MIKNIEDVKQELKKSLIDSSVLEFVAEGVLLFNQDNSEEITKILSDNGIWVESLDLATIINNLVINSILSTEDVGAISKALKSEEDSEEFKNMQNYLVEKFSSWRCDGLTIHEALADDIAEALVRTIKYTQVVSDTTVN